MKKIMISMMFVALSAPVFAQQTMYEGFDVSVFAFFSNLKKAIAEKTADNRPEWVKELQQEERKLVSNCPSGVSSYGFPARHFAQQTIKKNQALFAKRKAVLSNRVKANAALQKYTFEVPNPSDLTSLREEQARFLLDFFNQPVNKKSADARYKPHVSHPKAAETQLEFQVEGRKIILLINSRPEVKSVFFFLNQVPDANPAASKTTAPRQTGRVAGGHVLPSF